MNTTFKVGKWVELTGMVNDPHWNGLQYHTIYKIESVEAQVYDNNTSNKIGVFITIVPIEGLYLHNPLVAYSISYFKLVEVKEKSVVEDIQDEVILII